MLAGTLAFAVGIYTVLQLTELPSLLWVLLLPLSLLASRFFPSVRYILFFSMGFCWALIRAHCILQQSLPVELEQQDLIVEGVVASIPEDRDRYQRFIFDIHELISDSGQRQALPLRVRLGWYDKQADIEPGQVWRLNVRLKRAYGFMNPGGFDYEAWLLRKGIRALGYVKPDDKHELITSRAGYHMQRLRYHLAQEIEDYTRHDAYGLILALSLGDRSRLDTNQRKLLNRSGTGHLIAISGLHLGLVAGLVFILMQRLWSFSPGLTFYISAPAFASATSFLAAFVYAMLAGFALPTQRALIMLGVLLLAVAMRRPLQGHRIIAVALLLVLLIDPFALIAPDFWLSFMAVLFISYLLSGRYNSTGKLRKWFLLQLGLSVALLPLLIVWFNQLPLYSVLANIIAIPLIGLVVVPVLLVAMFGLLFMPVLSTVLYKLVAMLSRFFWWLLEMLDGLPSSLIYVSAPDASILLLALAGACILLMPRGLPGRWLGLVWFIPLLYPNQPRPASNEFQLTLLDVGQGLATVVQTEKHNLVFDTGARFSDNFNAGNAVVIPYLKSSGIKQLDRLIVSHGDNDHIGGASAILTLIPTDSLLTSVPEKLSDWQPEVCISGQSWEWDGVVFEILHPDRQRYSTGNNNSCVLRITGPYGTALLTGDIENQAETRLMLAHPDKLKADVLIVPHHGSKSSSTGPFLDAVAPDYALFAVGYRNRFRLPNQDILSRYANRDIQMHLSYLSGALRIQFYKPGLFVNEYRPENRRFWHNRAGFTGIHTNPDN